MNKCHECTSKCECENVEWVNFPLWGVQHNVQIEVEWVNREVKSFVIHLWSEWDEKGTSTCGKSM